MTRRQYLQWREPQASEDKQPSKGEISIHVIKKGTGMNSGCSQRAERTYPKQVFSAKAHFSEENVEGLRLE